VNARARSVAIAVAGLTALTTAVGVAPAPAAARSWSSMGPFSIGTTRAAVYKQHGFGSAGAAATITTYPIAQGVVSVAFVSGKVADLECGAAHLLEPCPAGFALPDGAADGTKVPRKKGWHNYTLEAGNNGTFTMSRTVTANGSRIGVILTVSKGSVSGIQLYRVRPPG
jgi:hypothetical protein